VALSLSIVSPSLEEARLAKAYWIPLPLSDTRVLQEHRSVAVQTFLLHLLSRVNLSPKLFAKNLRDSRFPFHFTEDLTERGGGLDELRAEAMATCWAEDPKKHASIREKLPKEAIVSTAKKMAEVLNTETLQNGIVDVWLGDYAEELIGWALGPNQSSKAVSDFLGTCLNFDPIALPQGTKWTQGPGVLRFDPNNPE